MEGFSNAVEPYRKSWAYAPIGIILGTIPWTILMSMSGNISSGDAFHLRRTLLAFLFTAAYVYIWTQGTNPHDAEIKDNTLADEMFLFLAGGHYLLYTKNESKKHVIHDFLFVILAISVIIHGQVAASANTYGFAVNAPIVFLMLSRCVQNLQLMSATRALDYFSSLMYFFSNVDVCNLNLKIMSNREGVPVHIRALFMFLLFFEFFIVIEDVCGLMAEKEETVVLKVQKSRSRSRSRCSRSSVCRC